MRSRKGLLVRSIRRPRNVVDSPLCTAFSLHSLCTSSPVLAQISRIFLPDLRIRSARFRPRSSDLITRSIRHARSSRSSSRKGSDQRGGRSNPDFPLAPSGHDALRNRSTERQSLAEHCRRKRRRRSRNTSDAPSRSSRRSTDPATRSRNRRSSSSSFDRRDRRNGRWWTQRRWIASIGR